MKLDDPTRSDASHSAPTHADTMPIGYAPTVPPPEAVSSNALTQVQPNSGPRSVPGDSLASGRVSSEVFDTLEVPAADPLLGVVVAERYRIIEPLGRGGMGIVYKVEHTRIGKLLAMKLLTGELSRNPDVVRRFKQEALTSSKLSSPNTVQVFDFGVYEGLTYLVMELVFGEDLGRALRAGPMPFPRLARVVIQVCNALAEAHQKGIVHRDIKPENVMLIRAKDGTDIAKVLDFGLAKLREGSELNDLTSQGAIVGTPYFMSPEQIRGENVDARSDIYSLGGLMYRALTAHYPFNGATPMSVLTKHLHDEPIAPDERFPALGISIGASGIVMRMLAKDPAKRFARVEEVQQALVEEIRALGASGIEVLLDSGALRDLVAKGKAEVAATGRQNPGAVIATRDEVEAYERKLRRQRYTALATFIVLLLAVAGGITKFVLSRPAGPLFTGGEVEPNNAAAEATLVPFGEDVSAYLGKRIDPQKGDRDFFAYEVPESTPDPVTFVRLAVTALPNIPQCTLLYKQGLSTPLAQYCVGRPGKDLVLDAMRLEPGGYFIAVMQDMDPYGAPTLPFVLENVSDAYTVSFGPATAAPDEEVEPNDRVQSANAVMMDSPLRGALSYAHDEDVFCAPPSETAPVRFRIEDVVRAAGSVLEATPITGAGEGVPVRIHAARGSAPTTSDTQSPWQSEPLAALPDEPRCVRLRLVADPWSSAAVRLTPIGGAEHYTVTLSRVVSDP